MCVAVRLVDEHLTVDALKRSLVQDFDTPVVTRTSHDRILFDVRTLVGDRDIETAASTLSACVAKGGSADEWGRSVGGMPCYRWNGGHVDHGKSALIEALTGKNPDRLEVERRRGMTVELGFGELALPSGKIVGLVDVPGHAHYLRAHGAGCDGH